MKLTRILRLLSLAATLFTLTAQANDITWTSTADGNWEDANNWTPNQVPGMGDNAFLNASSFTVTINSSVTIDNLVAGTGTGQQTITVPSGITLTVSNTAQIGSSASLQLTGGTLTCTNAVVNGSVTVNNGYLTGTTTVASGATMTLAYAHFYSLNLANQGTVNCTPFNSVFMSNAQIYNSGLWNAQGNGLVFGSYVGGNGSFFINSTNGIFRKSGAGTTTLDSGNTMINGGLIDVQGGQLNVSGHA